MDGAEGEGATGRGEIANATISGRQPQNEFARNVCDVHGRVIDTRRLVGTAGIRSGSQKSEMVDY